MDTLKYWKSKTGIGESKMVKWVELSQNRLIEWKKRYGKINMHNRLLSRDYGLRLEEKEKIINFYLKHREDGYRRVTYMMIDRDIIAVSPSTVYRVLKNAGVINRWNKSGGSKGKGYKQPLRAHEEWHTDVSYINICGTFYYFCGILDGYSRYIVHWELREQMKEEDICIIQQRAIEKFREEHRGESPPRLITDNGSQFVSKGFKEFIRITGLKHIRTSPYYPQSNGKIERFHGTLKSECIRKHVPVSYDDAVRIIEKFVRYYNTERLHSAIEYITPLDKLLGNRDKIIQSREQKLAAAREERKRRLRDTNIFSPQKGEITTRALSPAVN